MGDCILQKSTVIHGEMGESNFQSYHIKILKGSSFTNNYKPYQKNKKIMVYSSKNKRKKKEKLTKTIPEESQTLDLLEKEFNMLKKP